MGLNLKDITYENGKLMFTCLHNESEEVYFGQNIPKGAPTQQVRKQIYQLIAQMMDKEANLTSYRI